MAEPVPKAGRKGTRSRKAGRALSHSPGIMLPSISADGSTMVFRRGFDLWRFLPGSEAKPEKLRIWQAEDLPDTTSEVRDVDGTVDADFSPSKLEIVFKAEGELWAMDTVLREPNRLTRTEGLEDDPVFSPDGKTLASGSGDL